MSEVWDFKKDPNGDWTWQRQSLHRELIEEGSVSFKQLDECIADARRRGYTGSLSGSTEAARDAPARARRTRRG